MFGKNPKRAPVKHNGKSLFVQEIFKTIQGEGPNVGQPSIFIRLGGCNLACEFCDTEFEDFKELPLNDIFLEVAKLSSLIKGHINPRLIVITGGEPFRQVLAPLCELLINNNYRLQIETNGTLYNNIPPQVEIICSPKVVKNKYLNIHPYLAKRLNALKFLISSNSDGYSNLPDYIDKFHDIPIYLQPMDEYDEQLNRKNCELAVELAIKYGYFISYQLHKILNIR